MEQGTNERVMLGRESVMEMLPDEIGAERMEAMCRHVQREQMGLHEYKCTECGREFVAHTEHRYRAEVKGKPCIYCSYKCYRKQEKREEEAFRKRVLGAWAPGDMTTLKKAQLRVRQCEKKMQGAQEKRDGPTWALLTNAQKKRVLNTIAYWQAKLIVAEQELEEMKQDGAE